MTVLFKRAGSLIVGYPEEFSVRGLGVVDFTVPQLTSSNATGIDLSSLDYEFNVEKTLSRVPNKCDIKVYNLSKDTQKKLSGTQKLIVQLSAGYQEQATTFSSSGKGMTQLYLGEVTAAWTEIRGEDCITCMESGTSASAISNSRLNLSYGAKVPVQQAINAIANALGVGTGNSSQIGAQLLKKGLTTVNGSALSGNTARRLTDICRSAGLEWSIQDGSLQVLSIGKVLDDNKAILLSSVTGLINSPKVDTTGLMSGDTLLIPGLVPGVLLNMDSVEFQGGYRVEKCVYKGETWGQDWTCHFEAKKY